MPVRAFFYTNKSFTNWACSVMNLNLNSGFLPINSVTIVRVFSVSSAPSSVRGGKSIRINRRVFGDIVVSFNCCGGISPNPLKRETSTFFPLKVVAKSVPAALTVVFNVFMIVLFREQFNLDEDLTSTLIVLLTTTTCFIFLLICKQ